MKYRYRDDPETVVDATKAPVDFTTSNGLEVLADEWLVVTDDEELVFEDDHFQDTFERVPVRSLAKRRNPRQEDDGTVILSGAMAELASKLFGDRHEIDGYEIQDEEGNVITRVEPKAVSFRSPAGSPWRQDLEPTVEDLEIGPDGKPQRMRVKPVEWPPRRQPGETF